MNFKNFILMLLQILLFSLMRIFDGLSKIGLSAIRTNVNETISTLEGDMIASQLSYQYQIMKFIIKQLQYLNGKYILNDFMLLIPI